jgi:hypothetical protein
MEQVNKWLEESRNYEDRYFRDSPYAPRAQKAVRAVKDAADGMAVATALGGGIIVLLVGLFIAKRLRTPSYARSSALDDPRIRLLMSDMASESQRARAALNRESPASSPPQG